MRTLLAAAAALILAACAPTPETPGPQQTPTAQAACAARGGELRPVGRMQTVQCVVTYADAGKACTDGDQCQGDCRADPTLEIAAGAAAAGQCQADSDRFGCSTTIENGRAEATICID